MALTSPIRQIHLRCECHSGYLSIHWDDEFMSGYLWIEHRGATARFRDRLRTAARVLRGRKYIVDDACLDPKSVASLVEFFRGIDHHAQVIGVSPFRMTPERQAALDELRKAAE